MSRKDNNSGIRQTVSLAYWRAGEALCCHWCPKTLPLGSLTVDHIIPRWSGGKHSPSNAVLACGDCNTERDGWARFYAGLNASPPGTQKEERRAGRQARRIFPYASFPTRSSMPEAEQWQGNRHAVRGAGPLTYQLGLSIHVLDLNTSVTSCVQR